MTNTIQLSDASIHELTELCRHVLKKNANNEISVNMAKGISEYIHTHGVVTEKQAHWLVRNLDFYRITRPVELAHIVIEKRQPQCPPASGLPMSDDDFRRQIISALSRIETLLTVARA